MQKQIAKRMAELEENEALRQATIARRFDKLWSEKPIRTVLKEWWAACLQHLITIVGRGEDDVKNDPTVDTHTATFLVGKARHASEAMIRSTPERYNAAVADYAMRNAIAFLKKTAVENAELREAQAAIRSSAFSAEKITSVRQVRGATLTL